VKYHHPVPHTLGKALLAGTFCEDGVTRRWWGRAEVVASNSEVWPTTVGDDQSSFLTRGREERSMMLGRIEKW
jgi:hypothetical protein